MATEVDKRVVEMQFDNKDFERNCQASLTTLEKLKMALNFDGAKGLDTMAQAAKKIDMSNIAKGAEAVSVKFSAMNIAGMTAISELTKGFIGLGKKIWDMSFGLMKNGGMARTLKIEQANFQMKALAKNIKGITEDTEAQAALVERMVKAASEAVSGTAYGMDAAAAVTSQLMASGVTDSELMLKHLSGIAGAAAMTGRSFEDIGNIFTTVASNGRLMTMQLRQFSAAGLNLSATLGQSLGKSEDEINEMVTKGKISFEQFSKALSDAFGESAKEADNTFSGVTTNIQAQIKRIGQIFTDPFVEHVVPFLKEVKAAVKRVHDVVEPLGKTFEQVFSKSMKDAAKDLKGVSMERIRGVLHGIENIFASIVAILVTVKDAFATLFPPKTADQLEDMALSFELFTRNLLPSKETLSGLKNILVALLSPLRMVFNIAVSLWKNAIKPILTIITKLLGAILRLGNALKPFTDKLAEALVNFKFLDATFQIIALTIAVVVNWIADFINALGELLTTIAKSDSLNKFATVLNSIGTVIGNTIVGALWLLYNVISKILSVLNINTLTTGIETLGRAFEFLLYFIDTTALTFLNLVDGLANSSKVFGSVWDIIKNFVEIVKDFFSGQDYSKKIEAIKNSFKNLGDQLKILADQFKQTMQQIDAGYVVLLVFAAGVIFLLFSIKRLVDASTTMINGAANFTKVFTELRNAIMRGSKANGLFQVLVGISIAIGAFASAMQTIADLDDAELIRSAVAIGIFAVAVMGFAIAMTVLQSKFAVIDSKKTIGIFATLLALSGAILILSITLKNLAGFQDDFNKLITPFGVIISLMASLTGAVLAISNLAGPATIGALAMIGFSLAIKILITALKQIDDLKLDNIEKNLVDLIKLIFAFSAALAISGLGGFGFGAGMGFLGAALSLLIVLKMLKSLADQPFEEIKKGLLSLGGLLLPLVAFISITTVVLKLFGYGSLLTELTKLIFTINVSMIAMLLMVKTFSKIPKEELTNAVLMVGLVGLILSSIVSKILKPLTVINFTGNKFMVTSKSIKAISGIIFALAIMMSSIGLMVSMISGHLEGFLPALILVGASILGLSHVMKILIDASQFTANAKVGPILAVTTGITAVLSAVILMTALLPMDRLEMFSKIAQYSIGVMGAFALVIAAYSKLTKEQVSAIAKDPTHRSSAQTLAIAAAIVGVISAIGIITVAVAKLSIDNNSLSALATFFKIASIALIGIALFVAVANDDTRNLLNFQGKAAAMTGIFYSIGAFITALGVAMGVVLYASKDIESGRLEEVILMFVSAMAIFTYLGAKFTEFISTDFSGIEIAKASLSLFSLAGAFLIISGVITVMIKALEGVPTDRIVWIMGALSVTIFALLGSLAILLHNAKTSYHDGIFSDSQSVAANLKDVAKVLLALCASVAAISAAMVTVGILSKFLNPDDVTKTAIIWGMILSSVALLIVGIGILAKKLGEQDVSEFGWVALAITIASTAFVIIAGAIAGLAVLTKDVSGWKILGMSVALSVAIAALIGMMLLLLKFDTVYRDGKTYLAIAGAIAIAALAVAIIAHSLKTVANLKIRKNSWQSLVALGAYIGIIGGIMIALVAMQKANPMTGPMILAVAAAFVIASTAIVMIAEAMKIIADVANTYNYDTVTTLIGQIIGFLGALAGIAVIATIAVQITNCGKALAIGFAVIFGAVAVFAAAMLMFAESMSIFADAAEKFNDTNLDSNKISANLANAIVGFSEGLKAAVKPILEFAGLIILGIMAILAAQKVKMAIMGVTWFTAFVVGIAAAMPVLLAAFDKIIDAVIEYFEDDAVMEKWRKFFKTIGELLTSVILGALEGLLAAIGFKIDEWEERVKEAEEKDFEENHKFNRTTADSEVMGHAFRNTSLGDEGDALGQNLLYLNEQKKYLETLEEGTQAYDNAREFYVKLRDQAIGQLSNMTHEDWVKTVDYLNNYANGITAAGEQVSDEMIEIVDYLKKIAPDDVKDSFSSVFDGIVESVEHGEYELEQLNSQMTTTMYTTSGTLTRDKEAIDDAGAAVEDASDAMADSANDISKSAKTTEKAMTKTEAAAEKTEKAINNTDWKGWGAGLVESVKGGISQVKENMQSPEFSGMFDAIGGMFGGIFGTSFSDGATDAITGGLGEAAPDYLESLGFNKIVDDDTFKDLGLLSDGIKNVGESAEDTKRKIDEFRDGIRDSIASAMHGIFDEVSEEEYISPDEMLYRMGENVRRVGEWARNIATLAARGMSEGLLNELKDMGPAGAAKVKAFVDMTDEQLRQANMRWSVAEDLPDYGTKEIEKAYKEAGFNASLGFAEGIDPTIANDSMSALAETSHKQLTDYYEIESPSELTKRDGQFITQGLTIGMTNNVSQMFIRGACTKLGSMLVNTMQQSLPKNKFMEMGSNMLNGLPEGWNKVLPNILSKITSIANKILARFTSAWRISSPSKAFSDIAEYAMAGLSVGFTNGESDVDDTVQRTSTDILNSMKENINAITDNVGEDGAYQPVIRPVFDLTAMEQGYNDIQSWFANNQGINLNGNLSRLTPTTREDDSASNQQIIDAINNINNDDVVREIGQLRNDISTLQSAMTNLQVVMNTGALVGQIVEPMDRALGAKAMIKNRGRY